ncbi:hypothetical protein IW148_005674 [Coemansia sp. RSA 1199]|nr:hypothetical protein IW148_005674 [Coemansia sp. RSA 1199]
MLARVAATRLGMLDQRLPTLGPRTLLHFANTSVKPRALFHASAATRNIDVQKMTASEQAATFDPTLPGRFLGSWQKFTGFMSFYREGIKALWANRSEYHTIKRQIRNGEEISRAEFQIYTRYPNDRLRMVPFAMLVVLAPELIYLIIILMPGFCPSTCMTYRATTKGARRHDKLKQKLHLQALDRIRDSGLSTSDFVDEAALTKAVQAGNRVFSLEQMSRANIALMYRFFGIGSLSMVQPTSWLRAGVQRRLEYIRTDDALLYSEQLISGLGLVELFRACQERGIPAADLPEYQLRLALYNWVRLSQRQMPDNAAPIAWSRLVLLNRSVKLANRSSVVSSELHIVEAIVPAGGSSQVESTSNGLPVSALAEKKFKSAGSIASELRLSDIASEQVRDDEPQASIVQSTANQSDSAEANSGTEGVESAQEETDSAQAEPVHEETDVAPVESVQETDSAEGAEPAQEGAEHEEMDQAQDDGGHGARFTGMMPSEMFAWIQDESARDGDPDDQPATADEEELKSEDAELRTAEFASAIIAAMDDSGAA